MNPLFEEKTWRYIGFVFFSKKNMSCYVSWAYRQVVDVRSNDPSTWGLIYSCLRTRQPMQNPVNNMDPSRFPSITTFHLFCYHVKSRQQPQYIHQSDFFKRKKNPFHDFLALIFCFCFLALVLFLSQRDAVNHSAPTQTKYFLGKGCPS